MTDSNVFQSLTRGWSAGTPPVAWPVTVWKNVFLDCPLAVASHLQRFAGRQMQEQVQLLSDISHEQSAATVFTKEAAFLQQSAVAWSTELIEVAELVQSKLLASTRIEQPEDHQHTYPRAA